MSSINQSKPATYLCLTYQVAGDQDKKSSQSSVVTVIHVEGLDKLDKVSIGCMACILLCSLSCFVGSSSFLISAECPLPLCVLLY